MKGDQAYLKTIESEAWTLWQSTTDAQVPQDATSKAHNGYFEPRLSLGDDVGCFGNRPAIAWDVTRWTDSNGSSISAATVVSIRKGQYVGAALSVFDATVEVKGRRATD